MKNIDMEPLFESTYVLIDIVPSQVPESRAEEYLALEQEYTATAKRDALYEKFAAILTAVNNRFATVLLSFPEDSQTDRPSDEAITGAVQAHCRRGAVQLFLPDENALITLDGGDLNMTVYQPSADLLSFLQAAAAEQELYVWQPEVFRRIEKFEKHLNEAKVLLHLPNRSAADSARLHKSIQALEGYYGSEEWKQDFAADESGWLPKNLRRGVLSEDGIYNLLEEYKEHMERDTMHLHQLQWTRTPKAYSIQDGVIQITTAPHTDLWQRTYYHFCNDNAPLLQTETAEPFFSFTIKTQFEGSHHRFDQCGIVVYLDAENWLKASVEYENERFQHLGSVVTNHGYSDWATTEIPADVKTMWYRLSRREDDFRIECSADGAAWKQMRICHLAEGKGVVRFGVYACSPEDSSFTAVFTDWTLTECQWQAHDGQQPDQ